MRVNAINMLRQAAAAIDSERDHAAYAFMLEELARHLGEVRNGEHTWDEFAEFYCLEPVDDRTDEATKEKLPADLAELKQVIRSV